MEHPKDEHYREITLAGRLDFSVFKQFQAQYEPLLADPGVSHINLNMADVQYLDSSALGMLMLLREKAQALHKTVRIIHCTGHAREILELANLQKRFEITPTQ